MNKVIWWVKTCLGSLINNLSITKITEWCNGPPPQLQVQLLLLIWHGGRVILAIWLMYQQDEKKKFSCFLTLQKQCGGDNAYIPLTAWSNLWTNMFFYPYVYSLWPQKIWQSLLGSFLLSFQLSPCLLLVVRGLPLWPLSVLSSVATLPPLPLAKFY